MTVNEVEPGTMVRFKSGRTAVVGKRHPDTNTYTTGFDSMENYRKNEYIGMLRLDAEVEIVKEDDDN